MSNPKNTPKDDSLNGHNSKISRVYIELHNFNFMHGTFQYMSRPFIGRSDIRARLRSILTHSDSNSGTYLITGQRGVGKTSLVNKVLEELAPKNHFALGFKRYAFLFAALYVIMILKTYICTELIGKPNALEICHKAGIIVSIITFCFSCYYVGYFSPHRKKAIYIKGSKFFGRIFHWLSCLLREYLVLGRVRTWESRLTRFVKYMGILSAIHLIYCFSGFTHFCVFFKYGVLLLFVWNVRALNKVLINEFFENIVGRKYRDLVHNQERLSPYYYSFTVSLYFILWVWLLYIVYIVYHFLIEVCGIDEIYSWRIISCIPLTLVVYYLILKSKNSDILETACSTIKLICKQHFFFRHLFNTSKQLFIKINLGYDELKSVDVLRLVAHHITLEYRKYIFSFSFFWSKTSLIFIVCGFLTFLGSKFVIYSIPSLYINNWNIYEWITTLYEQLLVAINLTCYILIQSFNEVPFSFNDWYIKNQYFDIPLSNILFFLFLLALYKAISYIPGLRFLRAPFHMLAELEDLQDSIAASIRKEKGMSLGVDGIEKSFLSKFSYHNKTEKNYPMSDVHDIEKRLIDILSNIAQRSAFFSKPQFIIIFDELDKIEAPQQENTKSQSKTDSFSPETIRNRQEAIFKLLSGLKYFLTTAQAKFIFVAGREIYEASLADVVDRSHYLSSIFNDVINVPSFMSDFSDGRRDNIFSTTEQFVCRYLFPRGYITADYRLSNYYQYLLEMDKVLEDRMLKYNMSGAENVKHKLKLEREKIIVLLNSFIIYLTHLGKGAPKKIIDAFEKYVERIPPYKLTSHLASDDPMEWIVRKRQKNSIYYLKFDFYDQYTISLITYLVNPVILRFNSSKIHQHGDKLLASSFFFLDHLYKFHRNAFSWRALESSPELIDVNKTPELRDHITDLLHFLSQNHLKPVNNGLYNFCFYKKVSQEINFLTRVSEQASAVFNFTLDESYSVKQYYRLQLEYVRKQYEMDRVKRKNTIDELATLHFTLGELHLYDEEIEDAIIEFDNSYSILSTLESREMTSEQIIVLIKTMLSLGIAYERKKLNDQAFLIYSEAVRLIIASRNIELNGLGLYSEEKGGEMVVKRLRKSLPVDEPDVYFQNETKGRPFITVLDEQDHLHPDIHSIISKFTAYEGIRLLYLPLLAKFQMLEKSQLGGIQKQDIKRLLKEFAFLTNMLNKENKGFIKADFYAKVADILYYKNSMFVTEFKDFTELFPHPVFQNIPDCNAECKYRKKQCNQNIQRRIPCDACFFYRYALSLLLGTDIYPCYNLVKTVTDLLKIKKSNNYLGWEDSRFNLLAEILSNIGDIHVSCHDTFEPEDINITYTFLHTYLYSKADQNINRLDWLSECYLRSGKQNDYIDSITFYLLSALYYKKSTSYNICSFQYVKILNLIISNISRYKICVSLIANKLSYKAIKGICNSFKDLQQIKGEEINQILNGVNYHEKEESCEQISLRKLLINNDIFEIVLLYQRIRLLHSEKDMLLDIYSMFSEMSYEISSSIYNRIYMLEFKSEMNEKLLESYTGKDLKENVDNDSEKDDCKKVSYYVVNSICNLQEILKFVQIYGETYLVTNYFIARVHHKLMYWLALKEKRKISDKHSILLETPSSERANAIRAYYKAEELHKEGRTYKNMIERSCYLSDEYNDQRFHFLIAQERCYINASDYREIKQMSKELPSRDVYDVERFLKL